MTRTKSSRALLSVVLAVLMAAAFMPSLTYSSFAATAKKATKVTKVTHADKAKFTRTVGTAWTLKYKLSPSKLTSAAKKVVWKSSNSKVAKITTIKSGKAVVSFKSTGSASVTVYTKANKKAKTTWNFKVVEKKAPAKKVALTGVTIYKNSNPVAKDGAVATGDILTAVVAPAGASATYEWDADGVKVGEGATFKVTNAVAGKTLTVKANGNTAANFTGEVTSDATAKSTKVDLKDVTILAKDSKGNFNKATVADAKVGTTLKANITPDSIKDVVKVQWFHLKNGKFDGATPIDGATSLTYTLQDSDAFEGIGVQVTSEEADGKTVVKEDILGTMTTLVKANKAVKVAISTDGKTVAKNAKVGDTLTALVTPEKAVPNTQYQWYEIVNTYDYVPTSDGHFEAVKTVKKNAIAGANDATYKPTKAGRYGVEIKLNSEALRNGFTTNDADSYAELNVSAKDFSQVQIAIRDVADYNGDHTSDDIQNSATHPFGLYVPSVLNWGANKDYTIGWFVEHDTTVNGQTKTTTYQVVNGKGGNADTPYLKKGGILLSNGHYAVAGDRLYAKITGVNGSDFAGQTKESNKITLTNGNITALQDAFGLTAKDEAFSTSEQQNQWVAELGLKSGQNAAVLDGVNVAFYTTNDQTYAENLKNGGKPDYSKMNTLNAPQKQLKYAGNYTEGGKYVVAVVTKDGYNGSLAYSAVKENTNELFQIEKNKEDQKTNAATIKFEKGNKHISVYNPAQGDVVTFTKITKDGTENVVSANDWTSSDGKTKTKYVSYTEADVTSGVTYRVEVKHANGTTDTQVYNLAEAEASK